MRVAIATIVVLLASGMDVHADPTPSSMSVRSLSKNSCRSEADDARGKRGAENETAGGGPERAIEDRFGFGNEAARDASIAAAGRFFGRALGFRYDIVPLLQRQGCSSAYCHGSATGRGGFKLSLFGTDPHADHHAIAAELDGRRLDFLAPSNSLLLKKPSRVVAHGGGLRLPEDHAGFRTIERWISRGAPLAATAPRTLTGLEIERHGDRVRAFATFVTSSTNPKNPKNPKSERLDVSDRAVFESSNPDTVRVDKEGRIEITGRGESWVFAKYAQEHARHAIVAPFAKLAKAPSGDDAWRARLHTLGLQPAARASDTTLARRLYLDLAGRPPSPQELAKFLALADDSRVAATARVLTDSREFSTIFAAHLASWLELPEVSAERRFNEDRNADLRKWLRSFLEKRRPLRELVGDVFNGTDGSRLISRFTDPRDRSEFVGRAFLGTRIGCARCHNHPLDRWTQEHHLSFSAFFASPRPNPDGGMQEGLLFHPKTGDVIPPRLLPATLGAPIGRELPHDEQLTRFVLDSGHGLFARSIANRVFKTLLGAGLVEPVDDHRLSNPAIHEPMLAALARSFVRGETRLRPLVLEIVTSDVYALSSDPDSTQSFPDGAETRFFAGREARTLDALRFERSVKYVVGVPPLPSPFVGSSLSNAPLAKQLATINGPLLHQTLRAGQTNVDAIFEFGGEPTRQLRELWLMILSRPPRADELEAFVSLLQNSADRPSTGRDLAFALLASREFGSLR